MWVETWLEKRVDIAILGLLLIAVTIIFLLQDMLARHRRVYEFVRVGVLAFTWVGLAGTRAPSFPLLTSWPISRRPSATAASKPSFLIL